MSLTIKIDKGIYEVYDQTKTYRLQKRNLEWKQLDENERNKLSIDGYIQIFRDRKPKKFILSEHPRKILNHTGRYLKTFRRVNDNIVSKYWKTEYQAITKRICHKGYSKFSSPESFQDNPFKLSCRSKVNYSAIP